jgi:hypothetical protein
MNRTAGALVPVFLLVGFGLDSLLNSFAVAKETGAGSRGNEGTASSAGPARPILAGLVLMGLLLASFSQNYDLVFNQYYNQYRGGAWNSGEMGSVMRDFIDKGGPADNVWIVPYAFWVDTRLPPFWAGVPGRDIAIAPGNIEGTLSIPEAKLFMFQPQDEATRRILENLYPDGRLTVFKSAVEHHDFYVFRVSPAQ